MAHLSKTVVPALVDVDQGEYVRRQLTDLRRGGTAAVREEDLALADAAGIDRQGAGSRVRGVVLVLEPGPEVAERDPGRFAGPAAVDELRLDREHPQDRFDGSRRGGL